jgi:hypothetical protein
MHIAKEARIAGLITVNAQEYSNREAMQLYKFTSLDELKSSLREF